MVKEAGAARGGVSEGFFFAMDATNRASVDAAVAAVVEKYGGLDISVSVIGGGYVCLHSHARYITPHCIARHLCIFVLYCSALLFFFSSFLHSLGRPLGGAEVHYVLCTNTTVYIAGRLYSAIPYQT